MLTQEQKRIKIAFAQYLNEIWLRDANAPICRSASATAAQRCEAYAKVKGLW